MTSHDADAVKTEIADVILASPPGLALKKSSVFTVKSICHQRASAVRKNYSFT